ncbi:hypothetical protein KUTeg_014706 [Tegillarca granosa]|uniref:Ig-like domain-containing protein n=1 Tax=Tegillarca granosa TaxID=220873 RepID=A0ABQ9EVJ7_TEGGR|nr:hypothetical protein KUTeg_014706 [Tegillarca granosa]
MITSCYRFLKLKNGPTIDPVSPQEFIAARYTSVSCDVKSYPVANVTWTGPNNFQQTGKTLIFNKITKSHTGIYNCTATNTLTPSGLSVINKQQQIDVDVDILCEYIISDYSKKQFKQLKLDNRLINDKPEIMDIPCPSIVEGENLTLTCLTRANPTAHSYKWTKIGDNTFQQLSKILVITNIRRTQSGKYKCTAMNTMSPSKGQPETGEEHGEVTMRFKAKRT